MDDGGPTVSGLSVDQATEIKKYMMTAPEVDPETNLVQVGSVTD